MERESKEKEMEQNVLLKEKIMKIRDENVSLKEHLKKLVATDSEVENEMDNMNRIYVIPSLTGEKDIVNNDDRLNVVEGENLVSNNVPKLTKKKQKRLYNKNKLLRERQEMFDNNILF